MYLTLVSKYFLKFLFAFLFYAFFNSLYAVSLSLVEDNFKSPVLVTYSNDQRLYVVEKYGNVFVLDKSRKKRALYLDASELITAKGSEQGLLSIAFHPMFHENGYLFIYYTAKNGDNTLARLTVDPSQQQINLKTLEILFAVKDPASNHNGGMLTFGMDGYLYVGLGDGGRGGDPWDNAQNLKTLLGKLLRINVNQTNGYTIPDDNPFVNYEDARAEIWAYGLRNPWRHSFDSQTGELWIADVGQNKWEEIHWQAANSKGGQNYGWRLMEGNHCFLPKKDCDNGNLVKPVAEYGHKHGCSVTGGYVYRGKLVKELFGKYIFGDFCTGTIWTVDKDANFEMQELMKTDLNISSFGEDIQNELYVIDYRGGIYQFKP